MNKDKPARKARSETSSKALLSSQIEDRQATFSAAPYNIPSSSHIRPGLEKKDALALPVKYSDQQRSLRLAAQARKLIDALRRDLGQEFCADTRIVLSNIVQRNAFTQTYRYNYIL